MESSLHVRVFLSVETQKPSLRKQEYPVPFVPDPLFIRRQEAVKDIYPVAGIQNVLLLAGICRLRIQHVKNAVVLWLGILLERIEAILLVLILIVKLIKINNTGEGYEESTCYWRRACRV